MRQLRELAKETKAGLSSVAEGLIKEALSSEPIVDESVWVKIDRMDLRIERIEQKLLPLINTVNRLLEEAGYGDSKPSSVPPKGGTPAPRIVTHAEMYGPLERTPEPPYVPRPSPPPKRKGWWS
jgi:hypothetical protein